MTPNRLRNLDLGTLRSFATIADSGSMTRAASRLFMTQSAISMQIKRLESNLGFSVFDRSSQGMKPTTEGEQLLHYANQMLAINDEAMGRLTSPDYEGAIRLGAPCDVIYPYVPGALREYSRDFPRVQVKFSAARTQLLKEQFDLGQQDVILTTEREAGPGGRVLSTQPLLWTGAEDGVAWKKRPLPICFSRNCSFRPIATAALDDAGISWVDVVSSDDDLACDAMSAADLGVRAEMVSENNSGLKVINHGGQLPELPAFSIVLYANSQAGNQLNETLIEYLARAYN
jgi:DNA-binding transcriptional LysR family regulator